MSKHVILDEPSRRSLERGITALAKAVRVTLGPCHRNVILERKSGVPEIVDDGAMIAKEVELEDPLENTGARLMQEVANKTNDMVGDGTTTSIVLAQAMIVAGLRNVSAGSNPVSIRAGIEKTIARLVQEIQARSIPVSGEDITKVATISAGNDAEIGQMIGKAMASVGPEGVITLEESKSMLTEVEVVEGMQFDRGYISPYFVTDTERMIAEYEDAYLLIANKKISSLADLLPILEKVIQQGKALVIVAEDVDGEALSALVINRLRAGLSVVAVKAPSFGERRAAALQDLAILTGGQMVDENAGITLESLPLDYLGKVRKITIYKDKTTLVSSTIDTQAVADRVAQLRRELAATDSEFDTEKLQERIAHLTGGIGVIKVGAATETEMKNLRLRIEDALNATKAAQEEGIVAGGGTTFLQLIAVAESMEQSLSADEALGAAIVAKALSAPFCQILENAGFPGDVYAENARASGKGFDVMTETWVDMVGAGIIDPAKVARVTLQNAGSIAAMVLTTEGLVVEKAPSESA